MPERLRSKRRVFHSGCVRLYSTEYEPADAESLAILRAWDGKDLLVAVDPHDPTDAVAIDPATGATLGVLHPKRALVWGADRNAICAEMRHQRVAATNDREAVRIARRERALGEAGLAYRRFCGRAATALLGIATGLAWWFLFR